jgi:voltage-gated potassium channel
MSPPPNKWNKVIGALIVYSVSMFFIEAEINGRDVPSSGFFLWSERVVAILFTIEYMVRWYKDRKYPTSLEGIIDLVGFVPFWIGFFVPIEHLKWVRALRVLRLLKFHRYNEAMKHFFKAIRNVKEELNLLGFASIVIIVFSSIAMYEIEHTAKDTKFTKLSDGLWWSIVTLTTIGYGDVYPVTTAGRAVATVTILLGVGIFGTFISLMGSGLVQVFREERIAREKAEKLRLEAESITDDGH